MSTLDTVNNLGLLYAAQGRLDDAEVIYKRSLLGYEKALNRSMIRTYPPALNTLENMGDLLADLGRASEAQEHYTRAEAGIRLVYGSGSMRHRRITSKV